MTGREADHVLVEGTNGTRMRMRCLQPLVSGTPVAVAVRPEKMRLCADDCGESENRVAGVVLTD